MAGNAGMRTADVPRAVVAAVSTAALLDLAVDDAIVLHDSNKLAVRLLPCDVLARVVSLDQQVAQFEVELATLLAERGSPVVALEPRVPPRAYHRDGFVVTMWTYYETVAAQISSTHYADALALLHAGMRGLELTSPHFTDRVEQAQRVLAGSDGMGLADSDRNLLADTLSTRSRAITQLGAAERLLHGEPHPGNLLNTKTGPVFVDLETCCRGPVEFDLAHVPQQVSDRYPRVDPELLAECRVLVLAMVAAWRFDPHDQFPNRQQAAEGLLNALREGPPWPTLDAVTPTS
jgi:hypothetical protein